jgi:hypothetical protein
MFPTKFIKIQAKLITCNFNRYECKQINSFLADINKETRGQNLHFYISLNIEVNESKCSFTLGKLLRKLRTKVK